MMKKCFLGMALMLALLLGMSSPAQAVELAPDDAIQRCTLGYHSYVDSQGVLWEWSGIGEGVTKILDDVIAINPDVLLRAAIRSDNSLWMWGSNANGQLGNGLQGDSTDNGGNPVQTTPVKIMDDVAAVSCGGSFTAILKTDGTLWTCGSNFYGQLGNGGEGNVANSDRNIIQTVPVKIMDDVVAISCGTRHAGAIKEDGSLWMWGNTTFGELGNGLPGNRGKFQDVPVKVMDDVAAVSCGAQYSLVLKKDGSVWSCGLAVDGKLGNGGVSDSIDNDTWPFQSVWLKIMDDAVGIYAGVGWSTFLKEDGSLWVCGDGTLGNGERSSDVNVPIKIMDHVVQGSTGAAAITEDGSLYVWDDIRDFNLWYNTEDGSLHALDDVKDFSNGYKAGKVLAPIKLEGYSPMMPNGAASTQPKTPTDGDDKQPEQAGLRQSGSTSLPKLSKEEITQLLSQTPSILSGSVLVEDPSIRAPYQTGKVSQEALQAATDRLNFLRRLAGLPEVVLDQALSENAQYGAVLMASLDTLNHSPAQPSDMDADFYQQAYEAASTSNLSAGRDLLSVCDGLMNDSASNNVGTVGHRRWQLNPTLGKVGFGYVENPESIYGTFLAEKVFDTSGSGCDYDFIGWPASGNFPGDTPSFDGDSVWSVTLNPERYQAPKQSELVVTVTRQSDGKTWTLDDSEHYTAASSGRYFTVNLDPYGVANCIIFRPEGVEAYDGVYQVTIDGLRDRSGQPVDFTYEVDFFQSGAQEMANPTGASNWAKDSIREAVKLGIVPQSFWGSYTRTATRSEICALAVGLYESVTGTPVSGRVSFTDTQDENVEKAAYLGIVKGVGNGTFRPDDSLTREQAAAMLERLAQALGQPLPAVQADFADLADISGWALDAVGAIQGAGIMSGVGEERFAPAGLYSREQCIATLMRLYHWIETA